MFIYMSTCYCTLNLVRTHKKPRRASNVNKRLQVSRLPTANRLPALAANLDPRPSLARVGAFIRINCKALRKAFFAALPNSTGIHTLCFPTLFHYPWFFTIFFFFLQYYFAARFDHSGIGRIKGRGLRIGTFAGANKSDFPSLFVPCLDSTANLVWPRNGRFHRLNRYLILPDR